MPSPVRVGASRGGRGASGAPQQYEGATSGYGATKGTSVGYNPRNPYAFMGAQQAKAYPKNGKFDNEATVKKLVGEGSELKE